MHLKALPISVDVKGAVPLSKLKQDLTITDSYIPLAVSRNKSTTMPLPIYFARLPLKRGFSPASPMF